MRHTEESIKRVKKSLAEMWLLVQGQVEKVSAALLERNRELALEVRSREKMVDAYELTVDRECENFFALLTPVAVDLRMMLSIVKINNNLERMGDFADRTARFVMGCGAAEIDPVLLKNLRLEEMSAQVLSMLSMAKKALENEDISLATTVLAKDNVVDEINARAPHALADHIKQHPEDTLLCLGLLSVVRKLERAGDHITNMAEEIVFFIDAKVLKHSGKKEE